MPEKEVGVLHPQAPNESGLFSFPNDSNRQRHFSRASNARLRRTLSCAHIFLAPPIAFKDHATFLGASPTSRATIAIRITLRESSRSPSPSPNHHLNLIQLYHALEAWTYTEETLYAFIASPLFVKLPECKED